MRSFSQFGHWSFGSIVCRVSVICEVWHGNLLSTTENQLSDLPNSQLGALAPHEPHAQTQALACERGQPLDQPDVLTVVRERETIFGIGVIDAFDQFAERIDDAVVLLRARGSIALRLDVNAIGAPPHDGYAVAVGLQ